MDSGRHALHFRENGSVIPLIVKRRDVAAPRLRRALVLIDGLAIALLGFCVLLFPQPNIR